MPRFSYYLSGELFIESDLDAREIESLLQDLLTLSRRDIVITPARIEVHSPRRA